MEDIIITYDDKKNKKIIRPRSHTTKDMYAYYKRKYPESTEPYWMFKEVLSRYNKKSADAVIFGKVLNFGSRIGNLLIKKIRRNYKKAIVDWGTSKRLKAEIIASGEVPRGPENPEGPAWLVYFTDPWYLRWAWSKRRICRVRYASAYEFIPTSDRSKTANNTDLSKLGNRGKLALAVKLNPSLTTVYENHVKINDY